MWKQNFDVLSILIHRDRLKNFIWLSKDIVHCPPISYQFLSQLVQNIFSSIEHLLLSNTPLGATFHMTVLVFRWQLVIISGVHNLRFLVV